MASEEEKKCNSGHSEKQSEKYDHRSDCGIQVQDGVGLLPFPNRCQRDRRWQSTYPFTQALEIKNFLGFKVNKRIDAPEGVIITKKEEEKNNVTIQGIDLDKVSQVCARVHQSTIIQEKDLRSFLDGIYIQDARLEFNDWSNVPI